MLRRSTFFSKAALRIALAAGALITTAACGSSPTTAATSGPTSPFLAGPPAAVGDGLVCAAAADRLLGIHDGLDLRQFTRGAKRPQSEKIQQPLAQYLSTSSASLRQQAAGLIQGQCEAYGFYPVTYQECIGSTKSPSNNVVHGCIERRRWTVYTQQ